MLITKECFPEAINSPARKIGARVELFEGSTLLQVCCYRESLKEFTVERVGEEGKFFGFGICHRLNVHLIDPERKLNITTANSIEVEFGAGCEYMYPFPAFYVSEVHRDEKTNELSITAYDKLYAATAHFVQEIEEKHGTYTIREFAEYCGTILGLPVKFENLEDDEAFDTLYPKGANFEGTETIRDALNDIAEATQTIYFVNNQWELTFKRLDVAGEPVLNISKEKYFELDSGTNRRLANICSATELGDNVITSTTQTGSTQYVRDNPFWELRDDITTLLDAAIARMGGITINQFDCSWRGNFALEIGDKISLTTKDDDVVNSYVINDVISYNGFFSQKTQWHYEENDNETETNTTTIGEALKQTYAKVDKVNKTIELVASDVEDNAKEISSIKMDTENITASVQKVESGFYESLENVNGNIMTLTNSVEAKMTAEEVNIAIKSEMANGVDKVITSTGFKFDEEGLTIEKSGSDLHTQITEDGMTVYRDNTEMLVANNIGVNATNLHATTYLIIGLNSRFEDYGYGRTGCFWIG